MEVERFPLVSVVIPTYSRNEMLQRAINSVLNQSYKNIEIIVVDDNDSESDYRKSTETIMKKYSIYSNIKYIKNKKNLGGALARNQGILVARGEIICFLDDDDEYLYNCIEEKVKLFSESDNEKLALVYGMCEMIMPNNKRILFGNKFRGNCLYELLQIDCISATSQWACKRNALLNIGMFSDIPAKQDSMLMLKLFELNYEIDFIDKPLSRYYIHDGIKISNSGKALDGEILLREYGRKLYDRLSTKEILEVEYSFSSRLMKYYFEKKMLKNSIEEMKIMFIIHPIKTVLRFIYDFCRVIKRNLKLIIGIR